MLESDLGLANPTEWVERIARLHRNTVKCMSRPICRHSVGLGWDRVGKAIAEVSECKERKETVFDLKKKKKKKTL